MTTADFLGINSYPAIVNDIHEKIKTASCATQSGNDLCVKLYANMNESITPIMELRKFSAIVGTEETDDTEEDDDDFDYEDDSSDVEFEDNEENADLDDLNNMF